MTAGEAERRLPPWLKVSLSTGERFIAVRNRIRSGHLHTVCESAACPNRNECWNEGTATFLLLGDRCTRSCRFCNIPTGVPGPVDHDEPRRVARAVSAMGLSYAVVTSVTRDDLSDGGAAVFGATIGEIRRATPGCRVEVLIPDFQGSAAALAEVVSASPDVLNHNVETVPSLYRRVRPGAGYDRSLEVIARASERGLVTKSGMMLGLGEALREVRMVMEDLRKAGCQILTIGQYLRPRKDLLPVARFYHPDEFAAVRQEGMAMGFRTVESAPLVRSSYHAGSALAMADRPLQDVTLEKG